MNGNYDIEGSFVIGDRQTDARLAENLGCRSLILGDGMNWEKIAELLFVALCLLKLIAEDNQERDDKEEQISHVPQSLVYKDHVKD